MKIPHRSGRIHWEYVGWLLALVGGLMAVFGQPAEANAAAREPSPVQGYPVASSAQA